MIDITVNILRYNPEKDEKPYYQSFDVKGVDKKDRVLDVLNKIKWEMDGSLTYRRSCAHGVCGSDGMKINGQNTLACQTLLQDIPNLNKPITIEPMPALPVVKDLVVDMTDFFKKFELIKPYLISKEAPVEKERLQSAEDADRIQESTICILCGCCSSSCPSSWKNPNYLGPAALLKAYRFVFDTRDDAQDERLDILDNSDGIWRCHSVFNCVEACPKGIDITRHLSALKKRIVEREF
ncbi:MAG: succinate dehydrogenase iron-sulfur subunit [Calditrichaeota bacterium]|nr:succinate dehydrogenase iron-sulfur subunit [Calditrichota bacterium]